MTDQKKNKNPVVPPEKEADNTVSNVCMLPPAGTLHTPLAPIPANSNPAHLVTEPNPGLPKEGEQAFETLLVALDTEGVMDRTLEQRVADLEREVVELKKKTKTRAKKAPFLLKD